jgi:hypothetical protein
VNAHFRESRVAHVCVGHCFVQLALDADNLPSRQTIGTFGSSPSPNLLPAYLQKDLVTQLEADFGLVAPSRDQLGQSDTTSKNAAGAYKGLVASWQDGSTCGYHLAPPGVPFISLNTAPASASIATPHLAPSLVASVPSDGLINNIPYIDFAYGAQLIRRAPRSNLICMNPLPPIAQPRVIFQVVRYKTAAVCNGYGSLNTAAQDKMFCVGTDDVGAATVGNLQSSGSSVDVPNATPGIGNVWTKFGIHAVQLTATTMKHETWNPDAPGSYNSPSVAGTHSYSTATPDTDPTDGILILNFFDPLAVSTVGPSQQAQQLAAYFVFTALSSTQYTDVMRWIQAKYFGYPLAPTILPPSQIRQRRQNMRTRRQARNIRILTVIACTCLCLLLRQCRGLSFSPLVSRVSPVCSSSRL